LELFCLLIPNVTAQTLLQLELRPEIIKNSSLKKYKYFAFFGKNERLEITYNFMEACANDLLKFSTMFSGPDLQITYAGKILLELEDIAPIKYGSVYIESRDLMHQDVYLELASFQVSRQEKENYKQLCIEVIR